MTSKESQDLTGKMQGEFLLEESSAEVVGVNSGWTSYPHDHGSRTGWS